MFSDNRTSQKRLIALGLGGLLVAATAADEPSHMPEPLRESIVHLAVVPGTEPTEQDIAGTYEKDTPGAAGGLVTGTQMGTPTVDLGPLSVSTSAPQLVLPGILLGSLYGHAKTRIQDFRDALAEDLANTSDQPLTSEKLAMQVYRDLQQSVAPNTRIFTASTLLPEDVDAVLYVNINDVVIDVRDDDAILKTTAEIAVRRRSDGSRLYRKWVYYQDQDSLANWTANDHALWRDYANFARHYLGREIAAETFSRVELGRELQPKKSASLSLSRTDRWHGTSKETAPTLAWDFELPGDNPTYPWAAAMDESKVSFDLEIYDEHRPVYEQRQIAGTAARISANLEPCKTYRWTVRPSFHVDGNVRYGEWMRKPREGDDMPVNGIVGKKASEAPAYTRDFASLKIDCRAHPSS